MNTDPIILSDFPSRNNLNIENGKLQNISEATIYELIRDIKDPEHPMTLEMLGIIDLDSIKIERIKKCTNPTVLLLTEIQENINEDEKMKIIEENSYIDKITVSITPTIPHCSMASIIGLCIKYQLDRYIDKYWIQVLIKEDTHVNYAQLNKQLNDKDRVNAAMENTALMQMIQSCLL